MCALALWIAPAGVEGQESRIRIDGQLTEAAWEEAIVVSDLVRGTAATCWTCTRTISSSSR